MPQYTIPLPISSQHAQLEGLQGVFQEEVEEDNYHGITKQKSTGDTWVFVIKLYQSWEGFFAHGVLLVQFIIRHSLQANSQSKSKVLMGKVNTKFVDICFVRYIVQGINTPWKLQISNILFKQK